jgi:hypothetical protein
MGDPPYNPWSGQAARGAGGVGRYMGDPPHNPWSGQSARTVGGVGSYKGDPPRGSPWSNQASRWVPQTGGFKPGSIDDLAEKAARAGKNLDTLSQRVGHAGFEFLRLATWSRAITRGTFAIESLGGRAVGAGGLGFMGAAGAAGILGFLDLPRAHSGIRALGTPMGRAGAMDWFTGPFRQARGPIGPRVMRQIESDNTATRLQMAAQDAARRAYAGDLAGMSQVRLQRDTAMLQARYTAAVAGVIPFDVQKNRVMSQWQTATRRVGELTRQLNEPGPSGGWLGQQNRNVDATAWKREWQLGYGGAFNPMTRQALTARGGADWRLEARPLWERGGARLTTTTAAVDRVIKGGQGQGELDRIARLRSMLAEAEQQQVKMGQEWIKLTQAQLEAEERAGQRRIRIVQQIADEEAKRLADLKTAQMQAGFGMLGMDPVVMRRELKNFEQILSGKKGLPRGAQLSPEMAQLMGFAAPGVQQQLFGMMMQIPDFMRANNVLGFGKEVPAAQRSADEWAKKAVDIENQVNKTIDMLANAIINAMEKVAKQVESHFDRRLTELESETQRNKVNTQAQVRAQAEKEGG